MQDVNYVSQKTYEKHKEKLKYLKTVKRKEIAEAIDVARQHGDLKENAEYHAAREEQSLNEQNILRLEDRLSRAKILDEADIPKDEIRIGAKAKLKDIEFDEIEYYTLVSELESDLDSGKISVNSPVGRALLGKKKGEIAEVKVPAGVIKYEILEITRDEDSL